MLKRNPGAKYYKMPGFLEELREGMKESLEEKIKFMDDRSMKDRMEPTVSPSGIQDETDSGSSN